VLSVTGEGLTQSSFPLNAPYRLVRKRLEEKRTG